MGVRKMNFKLCTTSLLTVVKSYSHIALLSAIRYNIGSVYSFIRDKIFALLLRCSLCFCTHAVSLLATRMKTRFVCPILKVTHLKKESKVLQ